MIGREERSLDHPLAGIVFLASSIYFYKHWIERMCRPFLPVESLFLLDPPSKKVGFCAGIFFIITYFSGRNRTYFVDFFFWGGEGSAIFSLFFLPKCHGKFTYTSIFYGFFEPTADFVEVQALCRGQIGNLGGVCCDKNGTF